MTPLTSMDGGGPEWRRAQGIGHRARGVGCEVCGVGAWSVICGVWGCGVRGVGLGA